MAPGSEVPYGAVEDGVIAARDGRIIYAGPRSEAPAFKAAQTVDCEERWITPGLIDCHTHLVYGGDRAHEFELRLQGATYEEIARAGGGILSSVKATRAASEDELFASADRRLRELTREGVTTVEIKSGYGLDTESETKVLRVARRIGRERDVTARTTFLGAHAVPPEYKGRSGDYAALVAGPMLDAVAAEGLADAVDVFCEGIAFSPEETRLVFEAAKAKGLAIKIHAEQLSNLGGAKLAAEMGALSADHLEHLDEAGVAAMAKAGTAAVVLPGAFYFLRETVKPPIDLLRKHGVPIALATDANPGTSPLTSPLMTLNMACTLFRLTPEEALAGMTRNAAKALGLQDETGTLEAGKACDLAIWEIERPAELAYRIGFNPLHTRIRNGQ
ncbi:imidazolonepropionase [Bosea sp. BH3]|uniref:imidazolonepropionase n=1 Tax=Bosea sp. BH3 TaxID=2871701 RepID=UPI0021CB5EA3|nr:imidazolonepropionase [Bosea sp. BH3]MCU4179197.1 imidazolonepropionase [Bosea sp. BH3]